jgi:general secretion pathway protein B
MSFILDALKKSESDRQRQSGPALFEVKVAPAHGRLPAWAIAIAVLLVVNLGIVAWLLLRHAAPRASAAAVPAAAAPAVAPPAALATSATPGGQPAARAPAAAELPTSPPAALPAEARTGAASGVPASLAATTPVQSSAPPMPPASAAGTRGSALAAAATGADAAAERPGPDDYAPAAEPAPEAFGHVRRGTIAGVPLYQQAATAPGSQLPQLRLDLHAYAERAQDRWVMINMHKLHEGESLEGVRVDHIVPEGVVLSFQGSQFLLPRD